MFNTRFSTTSKTVLILAFVLPAIAAASAVVSATKDIEDNMKKQVEMTERMFENN